MTWASKPQPASMYTMDDGVRSYGNMYITGRANDWVRNADDNSELTVDTDVVYGGIGLDMRRGGIKGA